MVLNVVLEKEKKKVWKLCPRGGRIMRDVSVDKCVSGFSLMFHAIYFFLLLQESGLGTSHPPPPPPPPPPQPDKPGRLNCVNEISPSQTY